MRNKSRSKKRSKSRRRKRNVYKRDSKGKRYLWAWKDVEPGLNKQVRIYTEEDGNRFYRYKGKKVNLGKANNS